jgi:hypothetical protein
MVPWSTYMRSDYQEEALWYDQIPVIRGLLCSARLKKDEMCHRSSS